ncbi:MAG TPA: HAD family phosphatase [Terriglobales bacterium]|nr:HAD family phosphatase [Terriglobales bacterium]
MPRQDSNNAEIEAVIFDYGEVLAHRPSLAEFGQMASLFGMGAEPFSQVWDRSRPAYDRGDLTAEAYWLKLAAEVKAEIAPDQIERLRQWEVAMWSNINPAMVTWSTQLKDAGIKTAVLSNMHPDLVKHVRTFQWLQRFTVTTFSAEVKLVKPQAAIYEHTLRALDAVATKTLFVDDREVNIKAARSLGIRAIQFRSVPQLRGDLNDLDFPILPSES